MRSLAAALTAAQKSSAARPYFKVEAIDRQANIRRLRWSTWYSGAEPEGPHAVAVPTDGSLNRLRVAGTTVYHQRVVSPSAGSDYTVWSALATVVAGSPVALMRTGATLTAFYMTTATAIKYKVSGDGGASWGSETALGTAAGTVTHLAAAAKDATTALLVVAVGATLYRSKMAGGAWGALGAWSNTVDTVSGLACHYLGDWNILLTGTEVTTLAPSLWAVLYGDGYGAGADTWSSLLVVAQTAAGSSVALSYATLGRPDVYRLGFREVYSGSVGYSRVMLGHVPTTLDFGNTWTEPQPFSADAGQGLHWAGVATAAFLTSPSRVYSASLASSLVDLTDRVVRAEIREGPLEPVAGLIELDNHDGALNPASLGVGTYLGLRLGGQINVSPGYQTTSGNLVSAGPRYWIDAVEHRREKGAATVVLRLISGYGLMEKLTPARPIQFAAGTRTVLQILAVLAARAGLELSTVSSSPAVTALTPAFALRPGQTVLGGVRDLLALVEDSLRCTGERLYVVWPQASDASVYSYGVSGDVHLIAGVTHVQRSRPTHLTAHGVGASGAAIYGEVLDVAAQEGFYVTRTAQTRAVTSATEAGYVAGALAREAAVAGRGDGLTARANVGQELWDVVDVTDPWAGYAASKRRVVDLRLSYWRQPFRYETELVMGEP